MSGTSDLISQVMAKSFQIHLVLVYANDLQSEYRGLEINAFYGVDHRNFSVCWSYGTLDSHFVGCLTLDADSAYAE